MSSTLSPIPSYGDPVAPAAPAPTVAPAPAPEPTAAPPAPVAPSIPPYGGYGEMTAERFIQENPTTLEERQPEPEVVDPTEKVVAGSVSKTFLTGSEHGGDWTWEQIRDFVVAGIEQNVGYFPRNPLTESGIFKSFKSRWGDLAGPIAIYSIDVAGGWWQNAPISVNRFCKGSDEYFAKIIAERLESALAQSA